MKCRLTGQCLGAALLQKVDSLENQCISVICTESNNSIFSSVRFDMGSNSPPDKSTIQHLARIIMYLKPVLFTIIFWHNFNVSGKMCGRMGGGKKKC